MNTEQTYGILISMNLMNVAETKSCSKMTTGKWFKWFNEAHGQALVFLRQFYESCSEKVSMDLRVVLLFLSLILSSFLFLILAHHFLHPSSALITCISYSVISSVAHSLILAHHFGFSSHITSLLHSLSSLLFFILSYHFFIISFSCFLFSHVVYSSFSLIPFILHPLSLLPFLILPNHICSLSSVITSVLHPLSSLLSLTLPASQHPPPLSISTQSAHSSSTFPTVPRGTPTSKK